MALTDAQAKAARPTGKVYKLSDGKGLSLRVGATGAKSWEIAYRFAGKQKTLYIGVYPEVSLKAARARLNEARALLATGRDAGIDPAAHKREAKALAKLGAADSFNALADEWLRVKCTGQAESTLKKKRDILDKNLIPWLGSRPIKDITTPELLAVLRRMESRGAHELARRGAQMASAVFRYAIHTGRAERNPAGDLRGALTTATVKHHPAITDPARLGDLLRAIDRFKGQFATCCALKLGVLFFVRPGELRQAEWAEFDLDGAIWVIPASRMKMRREHIVPLCSQALDVLRELQPFTGGGRYLFPALTTSTRPMSENTLNQAFRRMGFEHAEVTAHGLRATARTLLDEVLQERVDLIEHQLAHEVSDVLGRSYNRTTHLPARTEMMQRWADYLDKLKTGAEVIKLAA